jgi:hypothetical protein
VDGETIRQKVDGELDILIIEEHHSVPYLERRKLLYKGEMLVFSYN